MENYFSGFVLTGTEKVRCGFGNGDCLMADLERGIFAVADGSERNPWASKDLLVRYLENLSEGGRVPGSENLKKYIKKIYSEQDFRHKTTFSSVWIENDNGIINLHSASGGDSVVMVIDNETGEVVYKTAVDMRFAGRSLLEASMHKVTLEEKKYRVVIATDGYADLVKQIGEKDENSLHEILSLTDVHDVAARLLDVLDLNSGKLEYDDIGFVIFDPHYKNESSSFKLLIGGTKSGEEKLFINRGKQELLNEWRDLPYWQENPEGLQLAGIVLN